MFPPYMVDIDLIECWRDQESKFIIDKERLCIKIDPSKKVKVPTNAWLPTPLPDEPQMNNVDRLEKPEFEVTSTFTDLRDLPIDSDSADENENYDIRLETNTGRFQAR